MNIYAYICIYKYYIYMYMYIHTCSNTYYHTFILPLTPTSKRLLDTHERQRSTRMLHMYIYTCTNMYVYIHIYTHLHPLECTCSRFTKGNAAHGCAGTSVMLNTPPLSTASCTKPKAHREQITVRDFYVLIVQTFKVGLHTRK